MTKQAKTATATATVTKVEKVDVASKENIAKLYETHKTHSAVMRYLNSKGYEVSDIARALGKRYQHVRNVLTQEAQKKEAK